MKNIAFVHSGVLLYCRTSQALCGAQLVSKRRAGGHRCSSGVVICQAKTSHAKETVDRRSVLGATMGLAAAVISAQQPAHAFLGIGEDRSAQYTQETQKMIDDIKSALELEPNSDAREESMRVVKDESVAWVSKYRRDGKFSGRQSFSLMYSAVNALDGQLVSFGLKANVPKKRLDRMMKSIEDAERQLQRGR